MTDYRFGDVLKYPDDQGVGEEILFMYVGLWPGSTDLLAVMVLRDNGAGWEQGEIIVAGSKELAPLSCVVKNGRYPNGAVVETYGPLNLAGLR